MGENPYKPPGGRGNPSVSARERERLVPLPYALLLTLIPLLSVLYVYSRLFDVINPRGRDYGFELLPIAIASLVLSMIGIIMGLVSEGRIVIVAINLAVLVAGIALFFLG